MNNKIIILSVVTIIIVISSGIVLLQLMNQGTVDTQVSEEMLQINNSSLWFGYGFNYAQASVLIYNTRNTPTTLQEITILGMKSDWNDIYFWKGEIGSISSLSPASNELNGSSVKILLDGNEHIFEQAQGKIELEPYKAIVLYIKNAGNITSQNVPDGNVTIAVFTERNAYLTETTLKQNWPIEFTDTEQLSITNAQFSNGDTITLTVSNTGTNDVIINSATVNDVNVGITGSPVTVVANTPGQTIVLSCAWAAGNSYQIVLASTKGNFFPYNVVAP